MSNKKIVSPEDNGSTFSIEYNKLLIFVKNVISHHTPTSNKLILCVQRIPSNKMGMVETYLDRLGFHRPNQTFTRVEDLNVVTIDFSTKLYWLNTMDPDFPNCKYVFEDFSDSFFPDLKRYLVAHPSNESFQDSTKPLPCTLDEMGNSETSQDTLTPPQPDSKGHKESSDKLFYELDWTFIESMAERMATNKGKYKPYNWQKPIDVKGLTQALTRHFIEIQKGTYEDDGRPFGHLEAIACNMMMITYQLKNNKGNE